MPMHSSTSTDLLNAAIARWLNDLAEQGVIITDEHLVVRGWNRWLEEHTGYPADAVIGRPLLEAFPDMAARGFGAYYQGALVGEIKVLAQGLHRYVIAPRGRDVNEVRQSGRIAPLVSGGRTIGTVTVIEDVSERIAAERELRSQIEASDRARGLAEEAVRVKDEFIATLSHEMRTPLNAVIGWTQILRSGSLKPERMARALEVIERNSMAQIRLIDDMLDTARVMSGKLRLESQPVDLARIAFAAVDVVSPTAAAKDVTIQSNLQSPVMPMMGDPDRLQQIVWNLLANAIKFTPAGGSVTIGIEQRGALLTLTVADSGEGISPEFLPHLFERFQQADRLAHRRHAGLGLGLSLVRQLVELHGGRITVTSAIGEGSTFTVSFPSRPDLAGVAGVGVADLLRPGGRPLLADIRVLVVADDEDAREMITVALDQQGATVIAVESVERGVHALKGPETPQVVIASVSDVDPGGRLIHALEGLSVHGRIRAIAVTSAMVPEQKARLLEAGYNAHLSRPLSAAALVSTVRSLAAVP
jgi:PAS domain S-box-containing protein